MILHVLNNTQNNLVNKSNSNFRENKQESNSEKRNVPVCDMILLEEHMHPLIRDSILFSKSVKSNVFSKYSSTHSTYWRQNYAMK